MQSIDLERRVQFPGTRKHLSKLDVIVETKSHLIGIASDRFEPFRLHNKPRLSPESKGYLSFEEVRPYLDLQQHIYSGSVKYRYLDAARLVRDALAIFIEAAKSNKKPILYYLFHEASIVKGKHINPVYWEKHRIEIFDFMDRVNINRIELFWSDYSEWLSEPAFTDMPMRRHGENLSWYLLLSEFAQTKSTK